MTNRRTLYLPDDLYERLVKQAAREMAETGEQVSVSAIVRRYVERGLSSDEPPSSQRAST